MAIHTNGGAIKNKKHQQSNALLLLYAHPLIGYVMSVSATVDQQYQRLHRMQFFATFLLILACALFIFSCLKISRYPALAYLKAFAEAAMVGALADWFAVTALFRHPLGIPIPHTAILPQKQDKIANELGRFIENNFLQDKTIAGHIYQFHPTAKALDWLNSPANRQQWLHLISYQIPTILQMVKGKDIAQFSTQLFNNQYSGARLGKILANILSLMHKQNIDTSLLRALLLQLRHCLHDQQIRTQLEQSLLQWVGKIEKSDPNSWDRLKASLKINLTARIDDWIAKKVFNWADSFLQAILTSSKHPFWRAYRKQILHTERQLRRNSNWHKQLASSWQQFANSFELHLILSELWNNFIIWSKYDIQRHNSWWQQKINHLFNHLLGQALQQPRFIQRLDTRISLFTRSVVNLYKHCIAQFIANKVKSWDSKQMVDKIELSVGRDLQFIRINGTVVGGCIGVLIYILAQWLKL